MSEFYKEMQGIASSLLAEFQQGDVSYIAITPGAGPANNPGQPIETRYPQTATVRGVSFKYINPNTGVIGSDLMLTMPGAGVEPDMKGFVEVDGKRGKILQIVRKPAAGTPVAWVVIFRK